MKQIVKTGWRELLLISVALILGFIAAGATHGNALTTWRQGSDAVNKGIIIFQT